MTISAIASVPTAERAANTSSSSASTGTHNLKVEFTPSTAPSSSRSDARGADHPGDGLVTFDATDTTLDVRIDASSDEQLEGLKDAVARHLDRFAFREAPLPFDWKAA
jgi:hypothetical protein